MATYLYYVGGNILSENINIGNHVSFRYVSKKKMFSKTFDFIFWVGFAVLVLWLIDSEKNGRDCLQLTLNHLVGVILTCVSN